MVTSTRTRTPDDTVTVLEAVGHHIVPLLTLEYKLAFGEGGDPSTQAAFSVREFLVSDQPSSPLP